MAQKTTLRPHSLPGGLRAYTAKTPAATIAIHIISTAAVSPKHAADSGNNILFAGDIEVQGVGYFGGLSNYTKMNAGGNLTFAGAAGFYPRILAQDAEPAAGTGATQIDSGEMILWIDTNDGNRSYFMYNYGGAVTKIELV